MVERQASWRCLRVRTYGRRSALAWFLVDALAGGGPTDLVHACAHTHAPASKAIHDDATVSVQAKVVTYIDSS